MTTDYKCPRCGAPLKTWTLSCPRCGSEIGWKPVITVPVGDCERQVEICSVRSIFLAESTPDIEVFRQMMSHLKENIGDIVFRHSLIKVNQPEASDDAFFVDVDFPLVHYADGLDGDTVIDAMSLWEMLHKEKKEVSKGETFR